MSMRSLSFALILAPALVLTAACDKEGPEPVSSVSDSVADSDGEATESEGGDTEGGSDTEATSTTTEGGSDTEGGTEGGTTEAMTTTTTGPVEPPPAKPDAAQLCDWEDGWAGTECTTEGGDVGLSFCIIVDGEEFDTPCAVEPECHPGDGFDQGCLGTICAWDGDKFYNYSWSEPDCNTPLVVNLDGSNLSFEPASTAAFDISAVGECLSTDWPSLPWLALDRDGNGVIEDGRELFGTGTRIGRGERASDGFAALAALDADHDGSITAADPAFAELVLWSDHDGDRRGTLGELVPVENAQLVAIHLDYDRRSECDDRGNCGGMRSTFEFRGATGAIERGEIIDVVLSCQ